MFIIHTRDIPTSPLYVMYKWSWVLLVYRTPELTLRLLLIASTNFSVFALRVLA